MDKASKTWCLLSRGVGLVGVFLLAWWFLSSTVELGAVLREMGRVRVGYVGMASVLSLLFIICSGARVKLAVEAAGERLGLKQGIQLIFFNHASGVFLGGTMGGDFAGAAVGSRLWQRETRTLVGAVPLNRGIGLIGLIVTGSMFVAFSVAGAQLRLPTALNADGGSALWTKLAVVALGGIGVVTVKRCREFFLGAFEHFRRGVVKVIAQPGLRFKIIAIAIMAQLLQCGVMMMMLTAVHGTSYPWLGGAWVFIAIGLASMLPSFLGIGPRESAAVVLLAPYGIPETEAVATGLLCGALALLWGLMGGLGLLAARSGGVLRSGVEGDESND